MLEMQREQNPLVDGTVVSVVEGVLCFQLSMQVHSSLTVIGASDGKNVHSCT